MDKRRTPAPMGRDLILSEAERLFSTHGYEGVSIRDIAGACGVSNAAIYYHFANKQELYIQVLIAALARMTETLAAATQEPGTSRQRLARAARTHACLTLSRRSLAQFAIRDLAGLGPEAMGRVMLRRHARIPAAIEEILRDGVEAGEIKPLDTGLAAHVFLGMLHALNTQILWGLREQLDEESIRLVVEIFMDGVAARPGAGPTPDNEGCGS